ncbi:hypothetical protein [Streptomyces sp. NPDC001312]|uniref:hypothetical protein n=1 Tax=Streptomyces sp. NPDC001312 TaxID=3364561 RepID=UPI0036CA6A76
MRQLPTRTTGYALWRRSDGHTTVRESGAWSAAAWVDGAWGVVASGRRALVLDGSTPPSSSRSPCCPI